MIKTLKLKIEGNFLNLIKVKNSTVNILIYSERLTMKAFPLTSKGQGCHTIATTIEHCTGGSSCRLRDLYRKF